MTLDYYIADIRSLVKQTHDETILDDRLIIRWINTQRALWIKNQVNNEYVISESILQTIPCLQLKIIGNAECSLASSTSTFLATDIIPKPVEFKDRLGILDVRTSSLDGYSVSLCKKGELRYKGNGRYNKMDLFGIYANDKIYIKVPKYNFRASLLTSITIDIVAENPLQLNSYRNCNNKPCYNIDTDNYPISEALWEYMQGAILQSKYGIMAQTKEAIENDEHNDT